MINPEKYIKLINSYSDEIESIPAKQLKKVLSVLKSYYIDVAELANQSFPGSYAINSFIHEKYKFPNILKNYFNKFVIISKNIDQYDISHDTSKLFASLATDIIEFIYSGNLKDFETTGYAEYFSKQSFAQKEVCDLNYLLCSKIIVKSDNKCVIEFQDEEEKSIIITFYKPWLDVFNYIKPGYRINAIDVKRLKDNEYLTSVRSLIVFEPDYLVDVTELANSFQSSGPDYFVNFLKKIDSFSNNVNLQIGKIVNTIFDEIISEPNSDFDNLFEKALKTDPISFFDFFENNKKDFDRFKDNTKNIINNLIEITPRMEFSNPIVEPSFISPTYGLQGRLDIAEIKSDDYSEVNIIELKSGKSPSSNITVQSEDGKNVQSGVWPQHLAQVTGYNLLIDEIIKERFGVSSILYAQDLNNPLRNVPNTFHYKRLLLSHRNYVVGSEYALASRRFKLIDSNNNVSDKIGNLITQNLISKFYSVYNNSSQILREWFKEQIAFMYREIITAKTGYYGTNYSKPYSDLWKLNKFDNLINSNIITDMKLNLQKSNPQDLHLYFDVSAFSLQFSSLRQGDIVVLFHYDPVGECKPHKDQLLRGSIIETGSDYIILSLRNKTIPKSKLSRNVDWAIFSDKLESSNKSNLKSISDLLSAERLISELILGIRRPQFEDIKVERKTYLNPKQNEIFEKSVQAKDYFIIQGPPGTGKTSYVLRSLVEHFVNIEKKTILILAYTNRAVDEIESVISGIEPRITFLRLGSKASMNKSNRLIGNLADKISLKALYLEIRNTNVIISTVASAVSNDSIYGLYNFDVIISDEASQIPEYQLAGLLTKGKKFILIGDEKQLPSIIQQSPQYYNIENEHLSDICMSKLSISLFERLIRVCKLKGWDDAFDTLIYQARMHEDIQVYPNKLFYNNALEIFSLKQKERIKHFSTRSNNIIESILASKRIVFINCKSGIGFKESVLEAELVADICEVIKQSVKHQFNTETIGVITPYRVQCSLIKSYLTPEFGDMITVDTVERFQGSQREFIIMSTATNYEHLIPSLSNITDFDGVQIDRKLNVAITRAQSHFILIGNAQILKQSPIYFKLLNELKNEDSFFEYSDLKQI